MFKDIRTGVKTGSGALVDLADGVHCGGVIIQADPSNVGDIEIRAVSTEVDPVFPATDPTYTEGQILEAGDSATVDIEDPSRIFIFCNDPADKARFIYVFNAAIR